MKRWFKHKVHGFGKVQSSDGRYALVHFRNTPEPISVPWEELHDLPAPLVSPYGLSEPAPTSGLQRRKHPRPQVIKDIDWSNVEEIQSPYALSSNLWNNVVQVSTNGTTIRHKTVPLEPSWHKPEDNGASYLNRDYDVREEFDTASDFDHEALNAQEGDRRTAFETGYQPSPEQRLEDEINRAEVNRGAGSRAPRRAMSDVERANKLAALDKRRLDMTTVLKVRMETGVPWDRIAGVLGWPQAYVRGLSNDIKRLLGPELFKRKAPSIRTLSGKFAPKGYTEGHERLIEAAREYVQWMRKRAKYPGWRMPGFRR